MNINFICYNFVKLKTEKNVTNFEKKLLKIIKNYVPKKKLQILSKKNFKELISSIKIIFEKIQIFKNFKILKKIKNFFSEFFKIAKKKKIFEFFEIYEILNNYNILLLKTNLSEKEKIFQIHQMKIFKSFSKKIKEKYFYGLITNIIVEYFLTLKKFKNAIFEIKKSLRFFEKNFFFEKFLDEKNVKKCKTVFFVNKVYFWICLKNLNFEKKILKNEKKKIFEFLGNNFENDENLKNWVEKILGFEKISKKRDFLKSENLRNKSTYDMIKFKINKKMSKSGNFSISKNYFSKKNFFEKKKKIKNKFILFLKIKKKKKKKIYK